MSFVVQKVLIGLAVAAAIFLLVLGGVAAAFKMSKMTEFGNNVGEMTEVDSVRNVRKVNVLILGLDAGEYLSDTILLVSLDGKSKKVDVLSIPRDTYILFGSTPQKINAAIGIGKQEKAKGKLKEEEEMSIKKVKELTGIPIHYYVTVNFQGFRNAIDILEGVDIDVPINMYYDDPAQNLHIRLNKGPQHLDGKKAEQFVRFRSNNDGTGYPEGDIGRVKAQHDFIKALVEQKLKAKYLSKADDLFAQMQQHIKTNYGLVDMAKHLLVVKSLKAEDVSMYQLPGEARYVGDVSYYVCDIKKTRELMDEVFRAK